MNAVEITGVTYAYGAHEVLHDVTMQVPEGSICALLGPNGAGKTTLLQLVAGLRALQHGRIAIAGVPGPIGWRERQRVSYVAEGQSLPKWMRLGALEAHLAPLYPTWDHALADELRTRFRLRAEPKVATMSRGEHMKAALLCALDPRPKLLVMDEPFTGMDVMVKDELVRGLLETSATEGWTVLIASHDVGELELLVERVAILRDGRIVADDTMDALRAQHRASLREIFINVVEGRRPNRPEVVA